MNTDQASYGDLLLFTKVSPCKYKRPASNQHSLFNWNFTAIFKKIELGKMIKEIIRVRGIFALCLKTSGFFCSDMFLYFPLEFENWIFENPPELWDWGQNLTNLNTFSLIYRSLFFYTSRGFRTSLLGLTVSFFLYSLFGFYDSSENVVEMRKQVVSWKLPTFRSALFDAWLCLSPHFREWSIIVLFFSTDSFTGMIHLGWRRWTPVATCLCVLSLEWNTFCGTPTSLCSAAAWRSGSHELSCSQNSHVWSSSLP